MNGGEVRVCPAMEELRGELREMSACLEKMLTELRCMNMTLKACLAGQTHLNFESFKEEVVIQGDFETFALQARLPRDTSQ